MAPRFAMLLGAALLVFTACRPTIVIREPGPEPPPPPPPPVERPADRPVSTAAALGIPPGHLPRPGECRIWLPGTPPGQQRHQHSRACVGIARVAPSGSWIVYRPRVDRRIVHVRLVGQRRVGSMIVVRVFDAGDGRFLHEEHQSPDESPDAEEHTRDRVPDRRPPDRPAPPPPPAPLPPPPPPPPAGPQILGIAREMLPDPGQCRIWTPGTPPSQQRHLRTRTCVGIVRAAPTGSWIVYRPLMARRLIHVRVAGPRRPGSLILIRIYDAEDGRFVREDSYQESDSPDTEERAGGGSSVIEPPNPPRQEYRPEDRPVILPPPSRDRPQPPPPPPPAPQPAPPPAPPPAPEKPFGDLGIPPGHLPQAGECRIWIPGTPPGRQPYRSAGDCTTITRQAPAGSWIVYRPTNDRRVVHVRVVNPQRAGTIEIVHVFEDDTGRFLRNEQPRPEDHATPEQPPRDDRGRPDERPRPDDNRRPDERQRPNDQQKPDTKPDPEPEVSARPDESPPPSESRPERPRVQLRRGRENAQAGAAAGGGNTADLTIPPGQLPAAGQCRMWMPSAPPNRQRPPTDDCDGLTRQAPAGSWVVYRPSADPAFIHVRIIDPQRAGSVTAVRVFEAKGGRFVREDSP